MRKFIIAVEADLTDLEARSPERWFQNLIGSVKMRNIKSIKVEEVNEHSGVRVPEPKPKPKPKARAQNAKV